MTKIDLSTEHHTKNLVISCMDFRFRPLVAEWIDVNLNGSADLVSMAGASAAINNNSTINAICDYVGIGCRLHEVNTIYIIDHMDCGAYGGSAKHASKEDEILMHKNELLKAKDELASRFEGINIKTYIIGFDFMLNTQPTAKALPQVV